MCRAHNYVHKSFNLKEFLYVTADQKSETIWPQMNSCFVGLKGKTTSQLLKCITVIMETQRK